jgi:metallo-beta-lactamase family protein
MVKDIKEELKQGKSILIPCFAQSRTQDVLYFLYENFSNDENFKTPIYLDGKLALEINNVYRDIFNNDDRRIFENILTWENLHFVNQYEDSVNIALRRDEQKIVLSSNGMMTVGRVLNHLKANVENKNYTIMIVGYCAPTTIGGLLMNEKVYEVKIEGMSYRKLCKIIRYRSWSSHIQGMDLIKMLKGINTNLILLHHSDESKYEFRDFMEEIFRYEGKSTRIICSDKDNKLFFI